MKVYLFQPRFAPLVANGTKRTTIRPRRKHPTQVGDELSLRAWTGKPYRSKQRILREGETCKETHSIEMYESPIGGVPGNGIFFVLNLDGHTQNIPHCDALAQADGFRDGFDLWSWFKTEHGLPFEGELIKW